MSHDLLMRHFEQFKIILCGFPEVVVQPSLNKVNYLSRLHQSFLHQHLQSLV
ncbi:hypothetical protein OF001_U360025 [Pseudomonas sp. OF001]|nr:hypothetical protein OF001_U360025 [Pseudomonas sp. OF001]